MCVCLCVCVCVCVYVYVSICVCVCVFLCVCMCVYLCVSVYLCACVSLYMCDCVCVYAFLCVCVYECLITLCCRRRKGSSISMPPSWTIHHTSMWPSLKRSPLDGKAAMFLGTSRARLAAVVSRTSSAPQRARHYGKAPGSKALW